MQRTLVCLVVFTVVIVTSSCTCCDAASLASAWHRTIQPGASFGDPHKYKAPVSNRDCVAFIWSHPLNGTVLTSVDAATGAVVLSVNISSTLLPPLSGWVLTSSVSSIFAIGTMNGVMVLSQREGKILHDIPFNFTQGAEPAPFHCTFAPWMATVTDVLLCVVENDVNSSRIFAVDPLRGDHLPVEGADEEIVYTKLWAIPGESEKSTRFASFIAYGSFIPRTQEVAVAVRVIFPYSTQRKFVCKLLWRRQVQDGIVNGELFDNSNLDYAVSNRLFLYREMSLDRRQVARLNLLTGEEMWAVNTTSQAPGGVPDFDTYATSSGDFARLLVRSNGSTELSLLNGESGGLIFMKSMMNFGSSNQILLAGDGLLCSFDLANGGRVAVFNGATGALLGAVALPSTVQPTTGVTVGVASSGDVVRVIFGDTAGVMHGTVWNL